MNVTILSQFLVQCQRVKQEYPMEFHRFQKERGQDLQSPLKTQIKRHLRLRNELGTACAASGQHSSCEDYAGASRLPETNWKGPGTIAAS